VVAVAGVTSQPLVSYFGGTGGGIFSEITRNTGLPKDLIGRIGIAVSPVNPDPKKADTVYVLNTGFYRSNDGGRAYTPVATPHGDNHDLWIAPDDPERMIEGNDGGSRSARACGTPPQSQR
jgi:hypothetical protein